MLKKILVPTDGSPESAWAIPVAEKLAVDHGARALLVQVLQYPDPGKRLRSAQREQMLELSTELARSNLDALAARFRSSGIEVESSLLFGSPAGGLLDVEVEQHPDLVVMSTHGHTGVARFALGSVADRVVREGLAPVLLVRGPVADLTFARALVMLDGSGVAEAALPMIEELTAHPITSVVLFRAITDSEDRVAATTYFLGVKERLTGSGLQIELSVEVGDPTELIRHASEGVDVIVLATHGRGGFNRFRHGSVAERIVREADKPVLLVRAAAILPR
ncbi:MAG: hypothetical protein A3F84_19095 [Candidatus Handelsmanbacteria bacterium RIFCSPLOWO2_12_FULL_64_10]|uniref:UspA domain-containing protein n=1 Tax=Handelsmanbacteria sp. (strain RIFCSPLOWO2_12_FULL_64_10) TaxID=1817868 RepID=A0A1F6C8M4_HANXR|nr:MAG: hypothetical protein A3F84_19095 [Candidatus Handelsmanbacteria bacterium RIFCSPLOWO2_12_FULL_64_10]